MKIIFAALVLGWLGLLTAFAQEKTEKDPFVAGAADEAPKNISVQLEYIEMPHKDLTRLLMEHKPTSSDATALRMKVQEMVDKDVAKVMETQLMTARSQQKGSSESQKEFSYPMEFNPPGGDTSEHMVKNDLHPFNSALPTSFESRNVGSTFEIEPNLTENSQILDVSINSRYLWHTGENIWYESKDSAGNVYKTTTPNFYKIEIYSSATVVSGQYFLAGVVSPKDANGQVDPERKVMVFLKCDALSVVP